MKKILLLLALLLPSPALAGVSCSVPFNLQNGTTADASQVMANYNAIIACLANAAASGNNSDITALNGLTTPLTPSEGGTTVFIGGTASGSGNAQVVTGTTPSGFATQQNYTIVYKAVAANTTATTLQVGSAGVATVDKQSSTGPIALTGGEIATNQIIIATWDGSEYQINPVPSVQAGAGLIVSGGNITISQTAPYYPFDGCVNLGLYSSVASNLLTVGVEAADIATNPNSSHPVLCQFRNNSLSNGNQLWAAITTGMTINTNGTGASLGSVNAVPFRLWIVLFYNGGSPQLGLFQSVTGGTSPTSVGTIDETSLQSPTPISSAATGASIYYSPNGSSISNSPVKILGYAEFANGLTTAGTYSSPPTKVQLFGPGEHKPGDIVQTVYATTTSAQTIATTTKTITGLSTSITPLSTVDLVSASANSIGLTGSYSNGSASLLSRIARSSVGTSPSNLFGNVGDIGAGGSQSGGNTSGTLSNQGLDAPGSTSSVPYSLYIWNNDGTATFLEDVVGATSQTATMNLQEIWP